MTLYKHDLKFLIAKHNHYIIFQVAYQAELALTYVDKLLSDIQLEFRDKYKNDLQSGNFYRSFNFSDDFTKILKIVEAADREQAAKPK